MGREGLLPAAFGRTSGTSGVPGAGSLLQTAVSAVVVIGLAALVGVVQGALLRSRAPERHARIGQGNEAFQLDKAASS